MPPTPEQIKEQNRIRQARHQKKKRLEKAEAKENAENAERILEAHRLDLPWAEGVDASGRFYKSECRPTVDLLAIFQGRPLKETDPDGEEIEEDKPEKSKKKKKRTPCPVNTKFVLNAIEYEDDVPGIVHRIDPGMGSITKLNGEIVDVTELYEYNGYLEFRRWLDLRDKARKDLFWLCNLLNKQMWYQTHKMLCDMFVQKDFDGMYFKGYKRIHVNQMIGKQKRMTEDGIPTRTMLLFAPRSAGKSTIDGIDAIQWMLNCPEIRIMIATAFRDLATQLFEEVKRYYFWPEDAELTPFQILFPEYVLQGRAGESESPIKCPAAQVPSKEPHLWKTSMESSFTGKRCDIRKLDDVVDYSNSDNEETRAKLTRKINSTSDLVEPWGITDVVATRYFTVDWYGQRMNKDEDGIEPAPYTYLCCSSWYPKPGFETRYKALLAKPNGLFEVTEDMVDLWFPEKQSFAWLMSKLKEKKEISFKNQQLNIATDPKVLDRYINQFDDGVLKGQMYLTRKSALPKDAEFQETIQSWDIAYSETRTSDYSVGVTMDIYKMKDKRYGAVIVEIFFDKWRSSELPSNIVQYYRKYNPSKVYMENSNGVGFLRDNMENFAKLHGCDLFSSNKFVLRPVSVKADAKRNRIKNLEFLLGHGMLQFVEGDWIPETFKQLISYTGEKSTTYRKDDIPDALALGVVSHLPITALIENPNPEDVEKEQEERRAKEQREAIKRRMFGTHDPVHQKPVAPPQEPVAQPRTAFPRGGNFAQLPNVMQRRGNR